MLGNAPANMEVKAQLSATCIGNDVQLFGAVQFLDEKIMVTGFVWICFRIDDGSMVATTISSHSCKRWRLDAKTFR